MRGIRIAFAGVKPSTALQFVQHALEQEEYELALDILKDLIQQTVAWENEQQETNP